MLLKQMEYFITVVDTHSFTEAANVHYISQSAISQQIKALEAELGVTLLKREKRSFTITEAGKYFYKQAIEIKKTIEQVVEKTRNIEEDENILRIGYQRGIDGKEIRQAVLQFNQLYPDVQFEITRGTHEELYHMLLKENNCLVVNDQRRKFHDDYVNFHLLHMDVYIELSKNHPLASRETIELEELYNEICILVSPISQREHEREFYENIIGLKCHYLFVQDLEEARLLVEMNRGFMPIEHAKKHHHPQNNIVMIPLTKNHQHLQRNYCAFWKKEKTSYYLEEFADILRKIMRAAHGE